MIDYSDESAPISIRTAAIPTVPNKPLTFVNGDNVYVDWDAPYNGGSVITSYTILIKETDGVTWTQEMTNCDGTDSTIVA